MPAMANITVLNRAAANVVYVAATASAGDSVPAVWKQNALTAYPQHRPEFRVVTRDNQKRNGRVFKATFKYPVTAVDSTTSLPYIVATIPFEVSGTLPTNIDVTQNEEAFIQLGNLLVSTLIRAVSSEGYAPT